MSGVVFGTAIFMASLGALTSVGMVHYINVSGCFAIIALSFGFCTSHWCSSYGFYSFFYAVGFFINAGIVSISATFFGFKDKGSILGVSCIAYLAYGLWLFSALYFIMGPRIDDNISIGKNVLNCITCIYFGWAYLIFRLF